MEDFDWETNDWQARKPGRFYVVNMRRWEIPPHVLGEAVDCYEADLMRLANRVFLSREEMERDPDYRQALTEWEAGNDHTWKRYTAEGDAQLDSDMAAGIGLFELKAEASWRQIMVELGDLEEPERPQLDQLASMECPDADTREIATLLAASGLATERLRQARRGDRGESERWEGLLSAIGAVLRSWGLPMTSG